MSAALSVCTKCESAFAYRGRAALADALNEAIQLAMRQPTGEQFRALVAHMVWLESELRGRCTSCTVAEAAHAFADASSPALDNVFPMRRP